MKRDKKPRDHSKIYVAGDIAKDIELLVRRLEERAEHESAITASDSIKAAQYLKLIFPEGHLLYRTPWVRRSGTSSTAYAAKSMVTIPPANKKEDDA